MMKNMLNLILSIVLPLSVVALIFFGAKVSRENYDLRFIERQYTTANVVSKKIKPAGTTPMYRAVGGVIRAIPVTNQEEPTLYVEIEGDTVPAVVSRKRYATIKTGQRIKVHYYQPKYWGKPFAVGLGGE
jgi:hypothetical protein